MRIIFLLTFFLLLTSCATIMNQKKCNQAVTTRTTCGVCIRNQCEPFCSACTFNEPMCSACWSCVNYEKCKSGCKDRF